MSRIGKKPVALPSGVTAKIEGGKLVVKGSKGELSMSTSDLVTYEISDEEVSVQPINKSQKARQFWGMQRTLVQNLVDGVTEGFTKVLEITGVGYRAQAQGKKLKLQLGFSHDVDLDVPELRRGDAVHRLLPREAALLAFLLKHRGRTLSREQLLEAVWGTDAPEGARTVDTHVFQLRQKLEADPKRPAWLVTVHRRGYRLRDAATA